MSNKLIKHDFNLPCHGNELSDAENNILKTKFRLDEIKKNKTIDDNTYHTMFKHIVRVLDYVGGLSMPAFAVQNELEEMYKMKFLNSPELARKLWLDHYGEIHKPYNILKNRCYRLLDVLDIVYKEKFKRNPPNPNY